MIKKKSNIFLKNLMYQHVKLHVFNIALYNGQNRSALKVPKTYVHVLKSETINHSIQKD